MLGERWKALSDKEKIPYEKKAADDKQRYETEKARYQNVSLHWITPLIIKNPQYLLTIGWIKGGGDDDDEE